MNNLINSVFQGLFFENLKNNFVFSPASYQEAIHGLSLCLKGKNLEEILEALEITEDSLLSYIQKYKQNFQLENNNFFLYAQEYSGSLNKETIEQLKELNTSIQSLDFNFPDEIVNTVNNLVNQKTHGKINRIISKQDITPLIKFIILNCVYFKKEWLYEFDEKEYTESFFGVNKKSDIKFLNKQEVFYFYEDSALDIVEIPYKETNVCAYLMLPRNNLFKIIENFQENYNKIKLVKRDCVVNFTCPAFEIESTIPLNTLTKQAGVKNIFDLNKDWKLVNFDTLKPEAVLAVDKIIQKAYINLTKTGTEAAAATVIMSMISGCSMPTVIPRIKYINLNKPFVFILANKNNKDIPLFIGVVNQL